MLALNNGHSKQLLERHKLKIIPLEVSHINAFRQHCNFPIRAFRFFEMIVGDHQAQRIYHAFNTLFIAISRTPSFWVQLI